MLGDLPYRDLVDAAPDGLVVCDERGAIVLVNAAIERMFGYTRAELIGEPVEVLLPPPVRARHRGHFTTYAAQPRVRPMGSGLELRGRRKDGHEFPVEISLSPIRTPSGALLMTAGVRDVSDRLRLEHDARRATAYLTSAVEAVHDAFAVLDETDRVVLLNSAARALFDPEQGSSGAGLGFEPLVARAIAAGVFDPGPDGPDALRARWRAYHRDPRGSLDVRTATGRHLRVIARRTAEHGSVVMFADVTADVIQADELRHARAAAEAASAAKTEFLSSMSHELRTPLNAILGFAQLLARDRKLPLQPRQHEYVQHVLRGGEHLLRLIDDVLDLARIEAGRVSISTEAVALPELLDEVLHTLEPMALRHQVQLAPEPWPAALPRVLADRTRLAQILMNFGSNAIKYGRPGGQVRFRIAVPAATVRIGVADDGIGIPAEKQARIFEPFQRAGQEAGPIEGTGIGLAISRRLATLMSATLGFTSEAGVGSEFWIDVPAYRELGERPAPRRAADPTAPVAAGGGRDLVVYIEDNPSNITFMREVLSELPDVELATAPTAEIGLELCRARRPRVVIMDINLPGIDGIEATRRLRSWPETATVPVIALSAAVLVNDTRRAEQAGFHRYLTKPIRVDELLATMTELLAGPPA